MKVVFQSLGILIAFAGCASKLGSGASGERAAEKHLQESYAKYRSQYISNVKYQLEFDFTKAETFSGKSTVNFDLKAAKTMSLDFDGGEVLKVVANGKVATTAAYNSIFVEIPASYLKAGKNIVEVSFRHKYSTSPAGVYRYLDPKDQRVYLYSNFEPYNANKMFPCFDQPDLKATYQTVARTPKNWKVVTSNRESSIKSEKAADIWSFPESQKFSTYIYSLHAGDYKVWESQAQTATQKIPLRLYARQSMAKYVDIEEWFSTTRNGFKYFETYFGYPYPFKKYDQVVVPEFFSGAMENVAAVTFSENFLSKTTKERSQKRSLANVILHEMAHMWFGNLVTMEWWNDIWLNESFASYLASKAMWAATPYKEAWTAFYSWAKESAYFLDQSVSTHPITFDVPNTDVVFSNFDGITYGKGASTLKQLEFYLREKDFQRGLDSYFKQHAFGNTELKDFMAAMEKASGKDLSTWRDDWLTVPQVNSIQVSYDCKGGKMSHVKINQTAVSKYPVLRDHRTKVALYQFAKGKMKLLKAAAVQYSDKTTAVPFLEGQACGVGTLIHPNYQDFDYIKVVFDETSLKTIEDHISSLDKDLARISLWASLWNMVKDQKMVATRYIDIALKNLVSETNVDVFSSASMRVSQVLREHFPKTKKGLELREKYRQKWAQFLLKKAQKTKVVDEQKRVFDFYLNSLETKKEMSLVAGFLDKKPSWLKYSIDQKRRWRLLWTLSSRSYGNFNERLDKELKKDSSLRGRNNYASAKAAVPDKKVKQKNWEKIVKGPQASFPLQKMQPVMYGLFPWFQEDLQASFSDAFFEALKKMKNQDPSFLRTFVNLAPSFCTPESAQKLQTFVEQNTDLKPTVTKSLKIQAEEDRRCVKIRKLVSESL